MAEANKNSAPAKTSTTAVKKTDEKLSFFKRVGKWFREFKSEGQEGRMADAEAVRYQHRRWPWP